MKKEMCEKDGRQENVGAGLGSRTVKEMKIVIQEEQNKDQTGRTEERKKMDDSGRSAEEHRAKQGKKRKRRKRKEQKHTNRKPKQGTTRILYGNIRGQAEKMWEEIAAMVKKEQYDIVCLTETHWRKGSRGKQIEGYRRYTKSRGVEERKGGGLAIYCKETLGSHEWAGESGEQDRTGNERMWIVLGQQDSNLAIGVVYMRAGGGQEVREWNDDIESNLMEEIQQLKKEGTEVCLVGDFNGHIEGMREKQGEKTDTNGERVMRLTEQNNMEIVNRSEKCRGKWTWMQRGSKTVVDYVMMDTNLAERIVKMTVDEEGIMPAQG